MPSSDTIVFTSFPPRVNNGEPQWADLAAVTMPTHKAWADAHGYDYDHHISNLNDKFNNFWTATKETLPIVGFIKMTLFLDFLKRYKRACWLDADLVVTNPGLSIEDLWKPTHYPAGDILMPYDWNGTNATVIIARHTKAVIKYLWASENTGRMLFLRHPWREMEANRYFRMTPPYEDLIAYVPAKILCALLPGAYLPYVPTEVTEDDEWAPGDFAIHLSALPLERRIELAREYAAK